MASKRQPKVRYGPPFGAAVWAGGYVVLPLLGVYRPAWEYDLPTLRQDLVVHLFFGTSTAIAFRLLAAEDVQKGRAQPTSRNCWRLTQSG